MPAVVSSYDCNGCGQCVDVCPEGWIQIVDNFALVTATHNGVCPSCSKCVDQCPSKAIIILELSH